MLCAMAQIETEQQQRYRRLASTVPSLQAYVYEWRCQNPSQLPNMVESNGAGISLCNAMLAGAVGFPCTSAASILPSAVGGGDVCDRDTSSISSHCASRILSHRWGMVADCFATGHHNDWKLYVL
mmetsp:Transcript_18455/g.37131  ORF Transcript_18455/g.37131 Transcript_18455/m.37131 type:complete len:125 (+) Transcript_18455:67-441(+)